MLCLCIKHIINDFVIFIDDTSMGISVKSLVSGVTDSALFNTSMQYTLGSSHVQHFQFTLEYSSKVMIIGPNPCAIVTKIEHIPIVLLQSHSWKYMGYMPIWCLAGKYQSNQQGFKNGRKDVHMNFFNSWLVHFIYFGQSG
jgi:hypothetical protein